jgi:hypothetical protein
LGSAAADAEGEVGRRQRRLAWENGAEMYLSNAETEKLHCLRSHIAQMDDGAIWVFLWWMATWNSANQIAIHKHCAFKYDRRGIYVFGHLHRKGEPWDPSICKNRGAVRCRHAPIAKWHKSRLFRTKITVLVEQKIIWICNLRIRNWALVYRFSNRLSVFLFFRLSLCRKLFCSFASLTLIKCLIYFLNILWEKLEKVVGGLVTISKVDVYKFWSDWNAKKKMYSGVNNIFTSLLMKFTV